jgi:hypothetical protein
MAAYASALERVRGATCAGPRSAEAAIQLECLDTRRGEVERLIAASRTAPPAAAAASVGLLVSPTACGENAHRAELRLAEWTRSLAAGAAAFVPADDDADGRAAAAKLAYARGDLASARSHAERLMELRGGDAGAAEIAGLVALASGDDRRAGEIFSNAPAPSSARAAAMAKARAGGWQEALALLDRSIDALGAEGRASDPDLARHLIDRGWINKRLGRADAARADFERALAVARETSAWASGPENPEAAAARVGLGVLALDASQPAEAAEPLLAALALREQVRGDPLALAEARFLAARALHESDRDPARARELATRARIAAAEAGARGDLLGTAIERWLAANQTR